LERNEKMTSPEPVNDEEKFEAIKRFGEKLLSKQEDSPPEFEKVFQENWRDLLA
jgi:hypothetical protein